LGVRQVEALRQAAGRVGAGEEMRQALFGRQGADLFGGHRPR